MLFGTELIGAPLDVIQRAEDRELFRECVINAGLAVPSRGSSPRSPSCVGVRLPAVVRPAFTLGGHGGGFVWTPRRARAAGRAGPRREPDRPGAGRGVRQGLGRVRARGRPRLEGQRRHRLLDREPRPDGRAHGRLGDRRAADDPLGRGLPGASRRRRGRGPRGRRRDAAARTSSSPAAARPARSV